MAAHVGQGAGICTGWGGAGRRDALLGVVLVRMCGAEDVSNSWSDAHVSTCHILPPLIAPPLLSSRYYYPHLVGEGSETQKLKSLKGPVSREQSKKSSPTPRHSPHPALSKAQLTGISALLLPLLTGRVD